jgi:alternate signal-mediated exported protein
MNKLTKGAIAGAAGIALLLGGAGTFALWNTSIGTGTGNVSTGTMKFNASTVGTSPWTDVSVPASPVVLTSAPTIVPGDTVTYTQTVSVTGIGTNLRAQLGLDQSALGLPTDLTTAVSPATLSPITVSMSAVKLAGDAGLSGAGTTLSPYIITPSATGGTTTFTVVVTVKFDSLVAGVAGQGESVALSNAKFQLLQVRP